MKDGRAIARAMIDYQLHRERREKARRQGPMSKDEFRRRVMADLAKRKKGGGCREAMV